MSWKNSFHLRKVKRQNILLHCPKTFLSYLTHIYLFSFLLVFISLFPKALCWKPSPKKLVTLLSNQWWWKYFVSLGIKINLIALWISFHCANKFIYQIRKKIKANNPLILMKHIVTKSQYSRNIIMTFLSGTCVWISFHSHRMGESSQPSLFWKWTQWAIENKKKTLLYVVNSTPDNLQGEILDWEHLNIKS